MTKGGVGVSSLGANLSKFDGAVLGSGKGRGVFILPPYWGLSLDPPMKGLGN